MAEVISVLSGSGGMGKSLVSCNISCGLKKSGKKTLLTELSDVHGSDDIFLNINSETVFSLYDVLNEKCKLDDALTYGEGDMPDYIYPSYCSKNTVNKQNAKKLIDELKSRYDYIILDVSYDLSKEVFVSLSDTVILITDDNAVSVRSTSLLSNRFEIYDNLKIKLILNKVVIDDSSKIFVEDIIDKTHSCLLGIIPFDENVTKSLLSGNPIINYNTYSGRALENICKRIIGENVSEYETGMQSGFFRRNKMMHK